MIFSRLAGVFRLAFTTENPTGHYFLDLANPADFAVAEQVIVLNQWEILSLARLGPWEVVP